MPGFLGLHLEGPHLSVARKGAHDPALIRPMSDADLATLIAARKALPVLLTTVAPESVEPRADRGAGRCRHRRQPRPFRRRAMRRPRAYAEAGATMVTHLFNAMSQIGNREPGLVGAAHRHRHAVVPG